MTSHGTGLTDNTRAIFASVIYSIIAINTSLAGLAAANMYSIPPFVYVILGIAAVIAGVLERQFGIRDATVAAVAKVARADYPTYRTPDQ